MRDLNKCGICTGDRMQKVLNRAKEDPVAFLAKAIQHEAMLDAGIDVKSAYVTSHNVRIAVEEESLLWQVVVNGLLSVSQEEIK